MSGHKRGDHVFNHGLKQSLRDLSGHVRQVLQADPKQKMPTGASERIARLNQLIADLDRGFQHPAFALTVDKPKGPTGGDANSRQFGFAKQQLVFAFTSFLTALKRWEAANTPADAQAQSRHLHTACLELRLTVSKWAETAFDPEAAQALAAEEPRSVPVVKDGQKFLAKLRDDFIEALKFYQP